MTSCGWAAYGVSIFRELGDNGLSGCKTVVGAARQRAEESRPDVSFGKYDAITKTQGLTAVPSGLRTGSQ